MTVFAPSTLIYMCLFLTVTIAGGTLLNLEHFDLVVLFLQRESLDLSAFSFTGALWIILSLSVFLTADFATRLCLRTPQFTEKNQFIGPVDLNQVARISFYFNFSFILITLLWIAFSAQKVGGLLQLSLMAYADSWGARDVLLDNKLFTGMRLFYAALPATGCLAAALLAFGKDSLSSLSRKLCLITIIVNLIALFVLPIVMSQRLLLLQFLLSAFLVVCFVQQRIVGKTRLAICALVFLIGWVMREAVTNPLIQRPALEIGLQKLVYYFVNDLWNGFAPFQSEIPHSYGGVSLKGLFFLTFTEDYFFDLLSSRMLALEQVLGGGDFPFFTAAYVDFGPFGGAIFIALCAVVFRLLFQQAHENFFGACIYAQLGATLLFSTHGIYFTHQNFLFSIGILLLIKWISLRRTLPDEGHQLHRAGYA